MTAPPTPAVETPERAFPWSWLPAHTRALAPSCSRCRKPLALHGGHEEDRERPPRSGCGCARSAGSSTPRTPPNGKGDDDVAKNEGHHGALVLEREKGRDSLT
jgi:hypothetical protein